MTHIDWLNTLTSFGVGIAILILALGYIIRFINGLSMIGLPKKVKSE